MVHIEVFKMCLKHLGHWDTEVTAEKEVDQVIQAARTRTASWEGKLTPAKGPSSSPLLLMVSGCISQLSSLLTNDSRETSSWARAHLTLRASEERLTGMAVWFLMPNPPLMSTSNLERRSSSPAHSSIPVPPPTSCPSNSTRSGTAVHSERLPLNFTLPTSPLSRCWVGLPPSASGCGLLPGHTQQKEGSPHSRTRVHA